MKNQIIYYNTINNERNEYNNKKNNENEINRLKTQETKTKIDEKKNRIVNSIKSKITKGFFNAFKKK